MPGFRSSTDYDERKSMRVDCDKVNTKTKQSMRVDCDKVYAKLKNL